ncbi:MAG: hypothetical protein QNJ47_05670 [Nostocaceae cyanobacterium]|nr:hypothetical protein [Nostocaceae cyanobacterium]
MTAISSLENDILSHEIHLKLLEWNEIKSKISEFSFTKKSVIFSQTLVCDKIFFISDGIAASEQIMPEGISIITQFFSRGQFCSNITSALTKEYANDTLIAITDVNGVSMSINFFLEEYYKGNAFGEYLRKKILEGLLFDKKIICTKTLLSTEYRYRFLEEHQQDVIHCVPDKDIARFMGITPQGLSRFLKHRSA